MGWASFGKGLLKAGKFLYDHPEAIQVIAAATGNDKIVSGIVTVVRARTATAPPAPVVPVALNIDAPYQTPEVVQPVSTPPTIAPEVDLVLKWRGTLDRMSMDVLGYRMAEDELYNNAKLLERGDVQGVTRNLHGKK